MGGAVVAASEAGKARGDGERRSLMATNEQQGEKMLFDFTDPKIFGEEEEQRHCEECRDVKGRLQSSAISQISASRPLCYDQPSAKWSWFCRSEEQHIFQ